MKGFLVRHKPSGKLLTAPASANRSQVLRKSTGTVFTSRESANTSIDIACDSRYSSLLPATLAGAKKRDFEVKEFAIDLESIFPEI